MAGEDQRRAIQSLEGYSSSEDADPWWSYYEPHKHDAEALMDQMRRLVAAQE